MTGALITPEHLTIIRLNKAYDPGNPLDGAPGALDTLNEIAIPLGDDANFAGTMTTALAGKLALAGGTTPAT